MKRAGTFVIAAQNVVGDGVGVSGVRVVVCVRLMTNVKTCWTTAVLQQ